MFRVVLCLVRPLVKYNIADPTSTVPSVPEVLFSYEELTELSALWADGSGSLSENSISGNSADKRRGLNSEG